MPPRRPYVRRNQNVEQEAPPALVGPLVEQVTHAEFRDAFQVLSQAMNPQANREWKEKRPVDACPLDYYKFKGAFIDLFFPLDMSEAKVKEFINLRQGNMGVKEYASKNDIEELVAKCPNW
ncbi:hypothetical protein MTR67_030589 [Solanum verrucosum]|uniref:Retrotransposon gag domain-containing protein n=1 Tax=Solanum verrucosum TaxID=315347 RepID=A0AAF0RE79_SOLVR|nr:hypothetical protein MTR67_030589 [Solanum verrucosum]